MLKIGCLRLSKITVNLIISKFISGMPQGIPIQFFAQQW